MAEDKKITHARQLNKKFNPLVSAFDNVQDIERHLLLDAHVNEFGGLLLHEWEAVHAKSGCCLTYTESSTSTVREMISSSEDCSFRTRTFFLPQLGTLSTSAMKVGL